MGKSFNNYSVIAKNAQNFTVVNGRYDIQQDAEKLIFLEVIEKLKLTNQDSLLDIGCGSGNVLLPLSFLVKEATGIDTAETIKRIKKRFPEYTLNNLTLIGTDFLNAKLEEKFDKILIYGVIQYMTDLDQVLLFLTKALSHLKPGGKLLVGDVPNASLKNRFLESKSGKAFVKEWNKLMEENKNKSEYQKVMSMITADNKLVGFDDEAVLKMVQHFRKKGLQVYILPQNPDLPFGNTREDLLIQKPL